MSRVRISKASEFVFFDSTSYSYLFELINIIFKVYCLLLEFCKLRYAPLVKVLQVCVFCKSLKMFPNSLSILRCQFGSIVKCHFLKIIVLQFKFLIKCLLVYLYIIYFLVKLTFNVFYFIINTFNGGFKLLRCSFGTQLFIKFSLVSIKTGHKFFSLYKLRQFLL